MTRGASLSVVIVAFNSKADLASCLPSLEAQGVDLEVLVVDNDSRDGTVQWLRQAHPNVRLIALPRNEGYAAASNRGIKVATNRLVLVLNPDTIVHPGALAEMLDVAEVHSRAFVSPKLLRPDGSLNTCGNTMHYTGITTCGGLGERADGYEGVHYPLLLSGAAILARRDAWLDVGGFDRHFFLYMEDTDLSLRARLKGYQLVTAANALVMHRYALGMHARKFYYLERNRLLTILKTFEGRTLRRSLPGLVLTELATWAFALTQGPAYLTARWKGYLWLGRRRREWQAARAAIQATRQIPDRDLMAGTLVALPYRQLLTSRWLANLLDGVTTPLYRPFHPSGRHSA